MKIVGWIFTVLVGVLLIASAAAKVFAPVTEETVAGLNHIGWDVGKITGLGILEFVCGVLFLIPKTSIVGAILVAGYMGGAIATHVRVDDPFIVQVLVPIVAWLGLWLRDAQVRQMIPIRK